MSIFLCRNCKKLLNKVLYLNTVPSSLPLYFESFFFRFATLNVLQGASRNVILRRSYSTISQASLQFKQEQQQKKKTRKKNDGCLAEEVIQARELDLETKLLDLGPLVVRSVNGITTEFEMQEYLAQLDIRRPEEDEIVEQLQEDDVAEQLKESERKPEIQRPETSKSAVLLEPTEDADLRLEYRKRQFQEHLCSYLDVCLRLQQHKRAHQTLNLYYNKQKNPARLLDNIKIYNIFLKHWASKGNINFLRVTLKLVTESKLLLSWQSYLYWLECLGRNKTLSEVEMKEAIHQVLTSMSNQGFAPEELFVNSFYFKDQEQIVVKVLEEAIPGFKPKYTPNLQDYCCNILKHLNKSETQEQVYSGNRNDPALQEFKKLFFVQMNEEIQNEILVMSIYKGNPKKNTKYVKELEAMWKNRISSALKRELLKLSSGTKLDRQMTIYPYFLTLPFDALLELVMSELKLLCTFEMYDVNIKWLYKNLALRIMTSHIVMSKQKDGFSEMLRSLYHEYLLYITSPDLQLQLTAREYWQNLITSKKLSMQDYERVPWPREVLLDIGNFLYDIILSEVKIDTQYNVPSKLKTKNLIPAFYTTIIRLPDRNKTVVKPTQLLKRLMNDSSMKSISFRSNDLPMVCPPLPWTSVQTGAFLVAPVDFMRIDRKVASTNKQLVDSTPAQQLYPIFDSLNNVSICPWIINKPILDLIIDVFNKGGDEQLGVPKHESQFPPLPVYKCEQTETEIQKVKEQRMRLIQERKEMYSLWCDTLYKLSIANHYRDRVFWFPHNLDFRGRFYATPPHFNHLGSDLVRSVLLFANGKPLGEKGLDWLKIHLVNLTGLKKRNTIEERLKFANVMMSDILDSADNPISGRGWWKTSDDPWQTLACCQQVAAAFRCDNPAEFVCHYPVHQDGSCNGLQHYAALGRDQEGAEKVNLTPCNRPQDVYSGVAAIVQKECMNDAKRGNQMAKTLAAYVSRKIVKQTVMTTVYGVTTYGAKLQIRKRLKEIPNFPPDLYLPASIYLAQKTLFSIGTLFSKTQLIQNWLTECARQISKVRGLPVAWVTPLGLPVFQPYYLNSKKVSKSPSNILRVNVRKQKNGLPPNFIHSLDSSHMMLTSLHCQRSGIEFVAVHDCFWTSPCSVEIMSKICREQFVALHNEPILENLSEYFVSKFCLPEQKDTKNSRKKATKLESERLYYNTVLRNVPEKGSFQLEDVLKSTYFFS